LGRLIGGITEGEIAEWVKQRSVKPFAAVEDFKSRAGLNAQTLAALQFR
jgi:hypothetical protein